MKLIGRIMIILLAVAVVSGVAILIVNATGANSSQSIPVRDGGFDREGINPGQQPPQIFEGDFRPGRDRHEGGGGFGLTRSLMMLIPLTGIVVVFLLVERLLDHLRLRRLAKARAQSE